MIDITQINYNYLTGRIFSLKPGQNDVFEALALELFAIQYQFNPLYRSFCQSLKAEPAGVRTLTQIPFLPIDLFKTHEIVTPLFTRPIALTFTSSGTTGQTTSKHVVNDLTVYEQSFVKGFELFYGDPANYCILALLPSYLERQGSSLVYMANKLIELSKHSLSGFHLTDMENLKESIEKLKKEKKKTLLLGVSYALLDLADADVKLTDDFIVMETGGMKGLRPEMLKSELHLTLKNKLGVSQIHSEYGMTELLSQAYSKSDGLFETPPWIQILIRDTNDPFTYLAPAKTGGISVIDLANLNSCCFIATQDLGKLQRDGKFELMGRFDNSDVRGCNLLIE